MSMVQLRRRSSGVRTLERLHKTTLDSSARYAALLTPEKALEFAARHGDRAVELARVDAICILSFSKKENKFTLSVLGVLLAALRLCQSLSV